MSTLFQICFWVDITSRRRTTSKQSWKNAVYVNFRIYHVEERRINVVYSNIDLNNVGQRGNKVLIFNVNFHNVGQCLNNVNMII